MACRGMPAPDRDGDAVRDEREYHPLDRGRVTRSGRLTTAQCSVRMIYLRERQREARRPVRSRFRAKYRRLRARCIGSCKAARLAKLERRVLTSRDETKERKRRIAHRRQVGACGTPG
jgi:hypothetical protein